MVANLLERKHRGIDDALLVTDCLHRAASAGDTLCILREDEEPYGAERVRVIVVSDRGDLCRLRWTMSFGCVDCSVASLDAFKRLIAAGAQHYLIKQLDSGHCIHGNEEVASSLQIMARQRLTMPPAPLPQKVISALGYQAEDLLANFHSIAAVDQVAGALTLASLLGTCIDCYFATNRLWAARPAKTIEVIEKHNPPVARMLRRVLAMPVSVLSQEPLHLSSLVAIACRDALELSAQSGESPVKVGKTPHIERLDGRMREAMRSYKRGLVDQHSTGKVVTA